MKLESVGTSSRRCLPSTTWMRPRSGNMYILEFPNKKEEEVATSRPESPASKFASPAPSNLIIKFARILTAEKEEQRLSQENETNLAKQKRTEQASKLAAAKANKIMSPVISVKKVLMSTMALTKSTPSPANRVSVTGGNKLW